MKYEIPEKLKKKIYAWLVKFLMAIQKGKANTFLILTIVIFALPFNMTHAASATYTPYDAVPAGGSAYMNAYDYNGQSLSAVNGETLYLTCGTGNRLNGTHLFANNGYYPGIYWTSVGSGQYTVVWTSYTPSTITQIGFADSANNWPAVDACGGTATLNDTGFAPPLSIAFIFPTNGTTTQDFAAYHTQVQIPNAGDYYEACADSASAYSEGEVCQEFLGVTTTLQNVDIENSYFFGQYNSSTSVTSTLYLNDITTGQNHIASSSEINFTIPPITGQNTTGTYTPPLLTTTTLGLPSSSFGGTTMSTSTCSGWTDIGCALGNIFANAINYLFDINASDTQYIAGFNFMSTQPWSFITDIQNDFQNAQNASGTIQTTALEFNLGNGNVSTTWFSASIVQTYFPNNVASTFKNLIYLFLIMTVAIMAYIEIKNLFNKK